MNIHKFKKVGGLAGAFLLLFILIIFNAVVSPIRMRADMTQEKLYTLSDGTKELLKGLDRDVVLKFYFSDSNENLPVRLKKFASRVRDLLKEYESRSKGYLVIEEYDPKPDSDEEEWAQRYGIRGQPLDMFGTSGMYFGLVAISGNREAVIPLIAPNMEPRLEYLLTRLVTEVAKDKIAKVGIMTSLPIEGEPLNPYIQQQATKPKWSLLTEIEKQYDVIPVAMNAEVIPDEVDTLMVIHPAEITENALYALDQFVLRGGHLVAFVDPMCLTAQQNIDPRAQQYGSPTLPTASHLNRLTHVWGIQLVGGGKLVADEAAASLLAVRSTRQSQRNPAWLSLRAPNINQKDVTTSSLSSLVLPFAGAFEGEPKDGLEMEKLLFTTKEGFLVDDGAIYGSEFPVPDDTQPYPLAVRLKGSFKSAFPDGKPQMEENEKATPGLQESTKPGVVVLVGDVDLLSDIYAVNRMNLGGQVIVQPLNNNLDFVANIVEQLCGSEALIGLRSRSVFDRPFDRVLELEKQASIKWKAQEEALNKKLEETRRRIASLNQNPTEGQQLMLSPEQEAEVKKFREEAFETQKSLKEVRKNLRKDIEHLGGRVKALNIMLIPLLITLFGIGRGVWIHKTR